MIVNFEVKKAISNLNEIDMILKLSKSCCLQVSNTHSITDIILVVRDKLLESESEIHYLCVSLVNLKSDISLCVFSNILSVISVFFV